MPPRVDFHTMDEHSQGSQLASQGHFHPLTHQRKGASPEVQIPTETLIDHLLNAKKALHSIGTLWRANEIVSTAQTALEESVVISARTGFLRRGITQQVRLVEKTRSGLGDVSRRGEDEFDTVIRSLDAADARLKATMSTLSDTFVASALRPASEQPRSLLSFIDLSAIDALRESIKSELDSCADSRSTFSDSLDAFDAARQALQIAIKNAPSKHRKFESPIPPLLHELETHAAEMAVLLDSLTSHFDLCANAVRHTEGGYTALREAAKNNRLPEGVATSGIIPSPSSSVTVDPISAEDRQEMLAVIQGDAGEVADVVRDLETRLTEMEALLPMILSHVEEQRAGYMGTTHAFQVLEKLAKGLNGYINSASTYQSAWTLHKDDLLTKSTELDGMTAFYDNYLASYDQLILEVKRRREREERMKDVLRKAMEKVERIREEDSRERDRFRREVGDFLPSDLWGGLRSDAPVWECVVYGEGGVQGSGEGEGEELGQDGAGGDEGAEGLSTPELRREVVEAAERREMERGKRPLSDMR